MIEFLGQRVERTICACYRNQEFWPGAASLPQSDAAQVRQKRKQLMGNHGDRSRSFTIFHQHRNIFEVYKCLKICQQT